MNPIDTDYTAYVVWAYGIGAAGIVALVIWTVSRLSTANRKLAEAEKDEAP